MPVSARPVLVSGGVAVLLAVVFLLAPPLGTDLSAQVARADFLRDAGFAAVDLRWYGGTVQYGYSLVAPAVMAVVGERLTGALAAVVSAVAFAALLRRTGAIRPLLGGVLGAACFFGNLASGRITFALGVAFGLLGLLALTYPARFRLVAAAAGVVLAGATSPVAGLFAGLAGVALALGVADRRVDGAVVAGAAALPLAATALLSDAGGWMNIAVGDTVRAALTGVVVALVVPRRAVRIGAVLSALGVATALAVHTPVGLNATRLASMFALPVAAAYAPLPARLGGAGRGARRAAGIAGLLALTLWQPPVLHGDLRAAGDPTASRRYFAPLLAELKARHPAGRVEVLPTRNYWEAAHVARDVYLARGWLRQTDLARNPLFFDGSLTGSTYEAWLRDNGVSHVALPDAPLSWVGRAEAALVRGGLPYLTQVWRGPNWTLYEVTGRPSIVEGATLVSTRADALTIDVPAAGEVLVRIRHSRWLAVSGPAGAQPSRARLAGGPGGWTVLRAPAPGRYTIGDVTAPGA
jgi:hypothetical protein